MPEASKKFIKSNCYFHECLYEYFITYIGSISGRKKIVNFKDCHDDCECAWEEQFKKGIYFKINSCSNTEIEITVSFENCFKSGIVKLVDTFYKNPKFSSWNEDKTKYGPIEESHAGCYIEIKTIDKQKMDLIIICSE